MQTIEQALEKLKKSDFRARFHLSDTDVAYIKEKGMKTIRKHGEDFIAQRLAPAVIKNDGRQTPMRGILYLRHSMLADAAVGDALKNGIEYHRA